MKEIIINSTKYGNKVAFVDDEDYRYLNQFKWRLSCPKRGSPYARAWTPMINGKRKLILMHREVMKITDSTVNLDHVDNNGLNNQKINLRIATYSQNNFNRTQQPGSSQFRGVAFVKRIGRWQASFTIKRTTKHLGYYHDERQAAFAYNWAAKSLAGDFARVNDLTNVF